MTKASWGGGRRRRRRRGRGLAHALLGRGHRNAARLDVDVLLHRDRRVRAVKDEQSLSSVGVKVGDREQRGCLFR